MQHILSLLFSIKFELHQMTIMGFGLRCVFFVFQLFSILFHINYYRKLIIIGKKMLLQKFLNLNSQAPYQKSNAIDNLVTTTTRHK